MRFLQTLQLKQCAWYESSPVMIASSRIGCPQTLQQYEQLAQTGEPSESNSKLVSAVTCCSHFAHLKQSIWKYDWPKATTTPPFSVTTDCLHPGQRRFSVSMAGSGTFCAMALEEGADMNDYAETRRA